MRDLTTEQAISHREPMSAPHSGFTENQMMVRTMIAMLIPAIVGPLAMGVGALVNILAAVFTAVVCHYILKAVESRNVQQLRESLYQRPYSAIVAGMIVGLCVGELSPWFVTAGISAMTMVVFKWGQEKVFGRKIVNPAAAAKAFVLLGITFMWFIPNPLVSGQLFYPEHMMFDLFSGEGFIGAMEFGRQMGFYGTENLSVTESLVIWKRHGWIGGASGVLTVISGVLLALWIKLKWRISVAFLVSMGVLAALIGVATNTDVAMRVAFHVFSGSIVFLAFYMATEPQTTPVTHKGQYLFAVALALLTTGLMGAGLFGASFVALVILNPFASYFDRVRLREAVGRTVRAFSPAKHIDTRVDVSSPVLLYDASKCIMCERCIKACDEIHEKGVLGFASRGENIFVTAGLGSRGFSECDGNGSCFEFCPTGALRPRFPSVPIRKWEADTQVQTTCANCGVGCRLEVYGKKGQIARIESVDVAPNYATLCVKGRFGHTYLNSDERLTQPLVRRGHGLVRVSWDEALAEIGQRLAAIKAQHGADAIGGIASSKSTNEENYLFQKFMRTVVGTNNVDHTNRYCEAPSVAALTDAFGCGAMTNSIQELKYAKCILVSGSNTTATHPVLARQIKNAVRVHGAKLIVVDPRDIELNRWATMWLRPKSGSDIAWINGLLHLILSEGLHDEEFIRNRTEGFAELEEAVKDYTPVKVAEITGIAEEQLREAAQMYAGAETASIVYATGITQHLGGVDSARSLANLALVTGNVGRLSTGVNPLQGQNNSQGASDMGAIPDMLPGYAPLADLTARERFMQVWGSDIPPKPGLAASEMFRSRDKNSLKALIVMGSNPILSAPNQQQVKKVLQQDLELLVVVDPFLTETAEVADVVLPAATFLEKSGSFTNTERRIHRVNEFCNPPGRAKPDWEIICALSAALGSPMTYQDTGQIMEEIARVVPIYGGVDHNRLNDDGVQWPCPSRDHAGTGYLYADTFMTESGKARFQAVTDGVDMPATSAEYPLVLTTGRSHFHLRTGTMSRRSEALNAYVNEPYIEISREDAERLGVHQDEAVVVRTKWGEIETKSHITDRVKSGLVFLPYHFFEAPTNALTSNVLSEKVKNAGLKATPCQVEVKPVDELEMLRR